MIQSNFLPWRGYFDFIDDCDVFVFYDDVQYTHKDWRNRNRIKTDRGTMWLSVPVRHDRQTRVDTAEIDYGTRWVEKHVRTLTLAYQKAPFFAAYAPALFDILRARPRTISELNIALIRWLMTLWRIDTRLRMSSEFGIAGDKFDRPLAILAAMGATHYLSGPAAKPYTDLRRFRDAGIEVQFKAYDYPEYAQLHGPFEGGLSIVDVLFNCGPRRELLKSRTPHEAAEVPQ